MGLTKTKKKTILLRALFDVSPLLAFKLSRFGFSDLLLEGDTDGFFEGLKTFMESKEFAEDVAAEIKTKVLTREKDTKNLREDIPEIKKTFSSTRDDEYNALRKILVEWKTEKRGPIQWHPLIRRVWCFLNPLNPHQLDFVFDEEVDPHQQEEIQSLFDEIQNSEAHTISERKIFLSSKRPHAFILRNFSEFVQLPFVKDLVHMNYLQDKVLGFTDNLNTHLQDKTFRERYGFQQTNFSHWEGIEIYYHLFDPNFNGFRARYVRVKKHKTMKELLLAIGKETGSKLILIHGTLQIWYHPIIESGFYKGRGTNCWILPVYKEAIDLLEQLGDEKRFAESHFKDSFNFGDGTFLYFTTKETDHDLTISKKCYQPGSTTATRCIHYLDIEGELTFFPDKVPRGFVARQDIDKDTLIHLKLVAAHHKIALHLLEYPPTFSGEQKE